MAISMDRYVDISSTVIGANGATERELALRLFSTNDLVPPNSYLQFTSYASVAAHFGADSEEAKRASFYFGFISKKLTKAHTLSFGRYVDADVAPMVWGDTTTKTLASFTGISDGSLKVTINSVLLSIAGMDFTTAASLAEVATIVQTGVRTGSGADFDDATVTYDAVSKRFKLTAGVAGDGTISIAAGASGTSVAGLLGFLTGATVCAGADEETITQCLTASYDASNNFASILFMDTLTADEVHEAATWANTHDNEMAVSFACAYANASTYAAALSGVASIIPNIAGPSGEYHEMIAPTIAASIDFSAADSAEGFMYQTISGYTPTVTTDTVADTLDALRFNYYGRTKSAGTNIDFYQRGVMFGGSADPVDINVFYNEIWLKYHISASLMTLLTESARIPANVTGVAKARTVISACAADALNNGVISIGRGLTSAQKVAIAEATGDAEAWREIQSTGYVLSVKLESYQTDDGRTEWKITYTLVYAKDDIVRKITGVHGLV